VAVAAAWSPIFAASLTSVGVLDFNNPYSEIRAVSQDGTYVVGTSTYPGGVNYPIIWSAADGLVALPCPSGQNTIAHGVAVGISANAGNIIISGLHENYISHRFYKAQLSDLGGGSWSDTANAGGGSIGSASNMREGTSNDLRTGANIPDGRWYTAGKRHDTSQVAWLRGDPNYGWNGTRVSSVASVSAYAVAVGRSTNSPGTAYYAGPGSAFSSVPGSTGVRADGFGISSSFGISSVTDLDMQWICGQVQNYNGNGTTFQAFRWKRGDAAMTFLGSLSPAGGGDSGNNSSVAYTVADNGVTAGKSFFDALGGNPSYEVATVWDTSGTWDNTGAAKSVQDLLNAAGVDTSAWTRLVRVWAASDDGKVLAGYGVWAEDGSIQGFVASMAATAPAVKRPRINSLTGAGTASVIVNYTNTVVGTNYVLRYSTNLGGTNWTVVGTKMATGTSDSQTDATAAGSARRFYRIHFVNP